MLQQLGNGCTSCSCSSEKRPSTVVTPPLAMIKGVQGLQILQEFQFQILRGRFQDNRNTGEGCMICVVLKTGVLSIIF